MTNKEIIQKINEGFASGDTEGILSHIADDVQWDIPGFSTAIGKEAFRKEIHNENFQGLPVITIKNDIAEGDYVAVEGEVQALTKNGDPFSAFFHNKYRLENGKVKHMTSYLVVKHPSA